MKIGPYRTRIKTKKSRAVRGPSGAWIPDNSFVSDEDINYCADLYIQLELFEDCWTHLQKYCGFGDRCDPTYTKYDFICAAGISLLALGEEEKANSYFDTFINEENNIDEYGDLWLHVCEHYLKLFTSWKSQQDISGLDL